VPALPEGEREGCAAYLKLPIKLKFDVFKMGIAGNLDGNSHMLGI